MISKVPIVIFRVLIVIGRVPIGTDWVPIVINRVSILICRVPILIESYAFQLLLLYIIKTYLINIEINSQKVQNLKYLVSYPTVP